uniref:Uncharacterized protein n=1 Tax=Cyclopterus lumpus TaxID=8103 RepID=A0A8C2WXZ4_CYCLU
PLFGTSVLKFPAPPVGMCCSVTADGLNAERDVPVYDNSLHIAVVQEELALVRKLIQLLLWARRGLDIYNNLRQTPLHLAVITQQANMVEALLRDGADPAALDRNGQTALHLCCEYDQRDCLSFVLSHSQSSMCLEIRNYEGKLYFVNVKQTTFGFILESQLSQLLFFVLQRGCDVNSQSYSGNTALHSACGRGQVDTVRLLLKSGADSSLKNYHNDTPVMVAKNKKVSDKVSDKMTKKKTIHNNTDHAKIPFLQYCLFGHLL